MQEIVRIQHVLSKENKLPKSDITAKNLRQGIIMKTSFKTRVLRMGLDSSVDINIFVMKLFFIFFIFIEFLKSKSTQMLRVQKGNSRVSFYDTLLNFGL